MATSYVAASYEHLCIFVEWYFKCMKTIYIAVGYHGLKQNVKEISQLGDRLHNILWLINETD